MTIKKIPVMTCDNVTDTPPPPVVARRDVKTTQFPRVRGTPGDPGTE